MESGPDTQHDLLALGEKLLTVVEPVLSSNYPLLNDIISPVAEIVECMTDTVEQLSRETRVCGKPSLNIPQNQLN